MEFHQVRYFLALSRTGNFTRAAAECRVAQPSLTRAVQRLEQELGGALFRRERGAAGLTDLGRLMVPYFQQMLAATDGARSEAAGFRRLKKAPVKMGVMCTIGPRRLVPVLNRLASRVPGLELTLREGQGQRILETLLAGELDVAVVGLPDYPDKVRAVSLYRERYVVAFPPGHRFEAMNAVRVADMKGENYLERLNCEYIDFFRRVAGEWSVDVAVRYQSEREDWIQAMILAGLGCAIIPEYMQLYPNMPTRVLIDPAISREISLLTVRGRRYSPALELFVSLTTGADWADRA